MAENLKKRKFNLFDGFIILVIIAAIVVLFAVNRNQETTETEVGDTLRYLLEFGSITPETAELFHEGDTLYISATKEKIGTVTSVEILASAKQAIDYDTGRFVQSLEENKVAVHVWVEASVTETDTALLIENTTSMKAGLAYGVWGPGYSGAGYVLTIERGGVNND